MENRAIKPKRVGALWGRTDRNGQQYLTGVMDDKTRTQKIKVFKNNKKREGDPDYIIMQEHCGQVGEK